MNVDKKLATAKRVAGTGQKVDWRCVVPGCNSNSTVKRHSFPQNVLRSEKWVQAINNPNLNGLTSQELSKYKVCQMHFKESAYSSTNVRQILKRDAIPELMLSINSCAASPASTSDGRILTNINVEDEKMQGDFTIENPLKEFMHNKFLPNYNEIQAICCSNSETRCSNSETRCSKSATEYADAIAAGPSSSVQNPQSPCADSVLKERSIISTPKSYERRVLLGSVTRKNKLTPVARRLHNIATTLSKKQSKSMHKLNTLKERLETTEKYMRTVEMKGLKSLSKAQLAFVEMHVRNAHKKAKASENCYPSCQFH